MVHKIITNLIKCGAFLVANMNPGKVCVIQSFSNIISHNLSQRPELLKDFLISSHCIYIYMCVCVAFLHNFFYLFKYIIA